MKKNIFILLAITIAINSAMGQKKIKYENLHYKDLKEEVDSISIFITNAISTEEKISFNLKIKNQTNSYIVYKPEESKFIINNKEMKVVEKWCIIKPNDSIFKKINLKGAGYNTIKNHSFVVDGLYKTIINENPAEKTDLKLPPTQNDFNVGKFNCTLTNLIKESTQTQVTFKCTYNGNKIGFIFPSKASVKMSDGNEYVNQYLNAKEYPIILMKATSSNFILEWNSIGSNKTTDMKKAEMLIKWNSTFMEADLEKTKGKKLELIFDEVKSLTR